MRSEAQTGSNLPRAKLLAVLDQAYDRITFAQNDTECIDVVRKLFGELEGILGKQETWATKLG
jgi:hypothetical protein